MARTHLMQVDGRIYVRTGQLPDELKRKLTAGMARYAPAELDLLRNDAFLRALRENFAAEALIDRDDYRKYIRAQHTDSPLSQGEGGASGCLRAQGEGLSK